MRFCLVFVVVLCCFMCLLVVFIVFCNLAPLLPLLLPLLLCFVFLLLFPLPDLLHFCSFLSSSSTTARSEPKITIKDCNKKWNLSWISKRHQFKLPRKPTIKALRFRKSTYQTHGFRLCSDTLNPSKTQEITEH